MPLAAQTTITVFNRSLSKDWFLLAVVVKGDYLHFYLELAHFGLTSALNKTLSARKVQLTGDFLYFRPLCVNLRDGYVRKYPSDCAVSETLRDITLRQQ